MCTAMARTPQRTCSIAPAGAGRARATQTRWWRCSPSSAVASAKARCTKVSRWRRWANTRTRRWGGAWRRFWKGLDSVATSGKEDTVTREGPTTMRRPLVVLGAHHSGGDLLAAALARCGARPVARGRVQAACEAPVSGHRVDWPVAAGAPAPELLEDPRLCLLLPAVRRYLEDPVCIHVYADPTDLSRDGLALWESYNASALHASEGLPRVFVSRSELLARPRECLDALLAALAGLGIEGLAMPGDPGIPGEPPAANARTATNLTPAQERIWRQLVSGGPGPDPQAPNDQVGDLKSKNRAQAREIEILNQRIAWLDAQVLEIQASRSWRITAPLRAASTKLRDMR